MSIADGIRAAAGALGIDPLHLATTISYETAGTFDPVKRGPTTQWGQHRGLIQWGEPQAKQFGVDWSDPVGSQLGEDGAIVRYMRNAGVQPGMGLLDIYSAVNAGRVGRYNASDANNGGAPGTVRDKVNNQMAGHIEKARALLGGDGVSVATGGEGMDGLLGGFGGPQQGGQQPKRFGDRLRESASNGDLWRGLSVMFNQMSGNPNPQIAQMAMQGRQGRLDREKANRTAEWLASQGMGDLAQGVAEGAISAAQAFAIHQARTQQAAPDPWAGTKVVDGQVIRMGADGTPEVVYAPEEGPDQDEISSLRREYVGLPSTKDIQSLSSSMAAIETAAQARTPAGDMALIFNYMKMLDPGSTVREGEYATAQNAAGLPERVRAMYNQTVRGEVLTDSMRNDFWKQAYDLYEARVGVHSNVREGYATLLGGYGGSEADLPSFLYKGTPPPVPEQEQAPPAAAPAQLPPAQGNEVQRAIENATPAQRAELETMSMPDRIAYLRAQGLLP